jgi:putative membrane protein
MKRLLIVAAGLGLLLAVAIIAKEGVGAVARAFVAVGLLGIAAVIMLRLLALAGAGAGWWLIFPAKAKASLVACIWVRLIREAINVLLPVAQIGGEIAGARVMTFFHISAGLAGATVLADMLMQVVALFLFVVTGIAILAGQGADDGLLSVAVAGAAIMAVLLAGFFAVQRFGGMKLIDRGLMKLADRFGWSALVSLATLHDNLLRIYADLPRFAVAMIVHVVVWFIGAFEVLVALRLMGHSISFADAVVIESLGHAVRAGAFLVPGALGVQEAGFIAIGAIYGIPPAAAVALSLVKRVPDLVIGVPFLFVWHGHEVKALTRRKRARRS